MTSFTFLTPLYLIGLLSAAIPLIIHLSRSRRTKKMHFSTTRFFTEQFLRSYRMSRLKELLLLACRMALFALLAMALARPLLMPKGAAAATAGSGPRAVMLVLDDSASMGCVEDGVTLFRRAQEAATTVLRSLGPGDAVSMVLAGRRATGPEVLFTEPTADHDEVQRAIDRAKVAALGTDLTGAIARAEEVAVSSRAAGMSVAVYVFSDMQESGWDLPARDSIRADASDTSFVFVSVRPKKTPGNRGVTAVRYAATRPRVGVPFAVRPLLALGNDDSKDVNVRLSMDGARVGEQKVERLPGGKWAAPRFYHTFQSGGWHSGFVEVDDETLPADNRRFFAIEVPETTQTVPVLAVNGSPSNVAALDELFFFRVALTATPEGQREPFSVQAISPAEVAAAELSKFPLVVMANVERLTENAVEKLEDYVADGGNLVVFLGDRVNTDFYNATLAGANRRNGGLLPATITGESAEQVGFIGAINYEHRALAAFQEPKLGALLGPSLTFKALKVEAPTTNVLMKASSAAPLLCEKTFGKGKVLLFTSSCSRRQDPKRDWSDFPIRPAFLLWSRFVAEYLTQTPLNLQSGYSTGDSVQLTQPADEKGTLWVRKPDGSKVVAPRASDGSGTFEFTDTVEPGVYSVLRSDQETRVGLFAVNLDSYESHLTYLDEPLSDESAKDHNARVLAELKERLGQPPLVSYVKDPATLADAVGSGRRGMKLWDLVLIVVLLVGLFEPWLANQISRRLYGRPGSTPVALGASGTAPRVMVETAQPVAEGVAR
jgi:hypothetical protein